MVSLVSHNDLIAGNDAGPPIFTPGELSTIHAALETATSEQTAGSEQAFQRVLNVLKPRFSSKPKPCAHKKDDKSTLRKIAGIAFGLKQKGVEISEDRLEIRDGLRATLPIPLARLDKLMDYFQEGQTIMVGKKTSPQRIQIKVAEVENGIMDPHERKCNIPNFDVDLEITRIDRNGNPVTFTAEIQFCLEGSEALLKQSRDAYTATRAAMTTIYIADETARENPEKKAEAIARIEACSRTIESSQRIREQAHEQIIEMFDLRGFRERRTIALEAREARELRELEREIAALEAREAAEQAERAPALTAVGG